MKDVEIDAALIIWWTTTYSKLIVLLKPDARVSIDSMGALSGTPPFGLVFSCNVLDGRMGSPVGGGDRKDMQLQPLSDAIYNYFKGFTADCTRPFRSHPTHHPQVLPRRSTLGSTRRQHRGGYH